MGRLERMAQGAHYGSRAKLADALERRVAARTPLSHDRLRSLVGAAFLFFSARRVYRALRAARRG